MVVLHENAVTSAAVISILHQLYDKTRLAAGDWLQQGEPATGAGAWFLAYPGPNTPGGRVSR